MANFQAAYYRDADGIEPVNDFIDRLQPDRQVVLDNQIDRLNLLSDEMPHLPFPHSSQIQRGAARVAGPLRPRPLPRPVAAAAG